MMHWLLITIWWRQCDHDANDIDCYTYVNCITLVVVIIRWKVLLFTKLFGFNMSSHSTYFIIVIIALQYS